MKNRFIILCTILICCFMIFPFGVKAETYKTLDLEEALAEEEIEPAFDNYKPNSDAITIYLFRGKGCSHCREFLTFMNSIVDEYGKYFKMETYEVWNDTTNKELFKEVTAYSGKESSGVPYIIIGDKIYSGYSSKYDTSIKTAIKDLYDIKKSDRYDIFKEMNKPADKKAPVPIAYILWTLGIMIVCSIAIIIYVNLRFKEIDNKIDDMSHVKTHKLKK